MNNFIKILNSKISLFIIGYEISLEKDCYGPGRGHKENRIPQL